MCYFWSEGSLSVSQGMSFGVHHNKLLKTSSDPWHNNTIYPLRNKQSRMFVFACFMILWHHIITAIVFINLYFVCVSECGRCEYGRSQKVVWGATWQRRCWSCTVTADEWVWSSGTPPAAASSSVLATTIRYHISTTHFRLHQQPSEFSCITTTTVARMLKYIWNDWVVECGCKLISLHI